MDPQNKPAWMTTEFYVTVIPTILFLYKMLTGHDTNGLDVTGLATLAAGIAAAGYAIARAITKRGQQVAQAMVTNQKLAIANDQESQSNARAHERALRATSEQGDRFLQQLDERISALEIRPDKPSPVKRTPRKVAKAASRKTSRRR